MKHAILSCFVFALAIITNAQQYNNGYLLDGLACAFRGIHVRGDTVLAHGFFVDTFLPYRAKYALAEFALSGTAIKNNTAPLDTNSEYYTQSHFLIEADGKMTFVGTKNSYNAGVLIRLNSDGTLDLHKEFPDSNTLGSGFVQVIQLEDSSYAILQQQYDGAGTVGAAVLNVSHSGILKWKKVISFSERPTTIALRGDSLLMASTTKAVGTGFASKTNTKFYHLDLNGNIVDTWTDSSSKSFGANKYFSMPDGGGIYVTRWLEQIRSLGGSPPSYTGMTKAYIVREDAFHNKVWEMKIGHPSAIPNLFQVKRLQDGNYLAVGGTGDTTYTDGQPYKNTGWLIKFDENGLLIWERKYFNTTDRPGQTNYLYDFVELPSEDIIAAGERIDYFENYPQQGWLLRLDRFGCLQDRCDTLTSIKDITEKEKILKVFPNPASDVATIDYGYTDWSKGEATMEIANSIGQIVHKQALPMYSGFQKLDVANYASGSYIVFIKRKGAVVATGRLVKE